MQNELVGCIIMPFSILQQPIFPKLVWWSINNLIYPQWSGLYRLTLSFCYQKLTKNKVVINSKDHVAPLDLYTKRNSLKFLYMLSLMLIKYNLEHYKTIQLFILSKAIWTIKRDHAVTFCSTFLMWYAIQIRPSRGLSVILRLGYQNYFVRAPICS